MSAENTRLELAVTLRFIYDRNSQVKTMLEPQLDFMWCTLPKRLTASYATIFVDEWKERRGEWIEPADFDNMMATLKRFKSASGIK
jgi:poly-gamma-glutamate synthesis protein (capsule biosynthesis protein)